MLHIRNLQYKRIYSFYQRREKRDQRNILKSKKFQFYTWNKGSFFLFFCKVSRSSGKYKRIHLNIEYREEKNKAAEVWIHSMFRSLAQGVRISKVVAVDQFCNVSWKSRESNVNVYICQYIFAKTKGFFIDFFFFSFFFNLSQALLWKYEWIAILCEYFTIDY